MPQYLDIEIWPDGFGIYHQNTQAGQYIDNGNGKHCGE